MTVMTLHQRSNGSGLPASRAKPAWFFLVEPFERAWHHQELIRAVVARELKSRFRDSFLGWVWAIFGPLLLLAGYTVAFSITMPVVAGGGTTFDYAASIFCGLVFYGVFSELFARGPTLLHEHATFVKKSIFPGETIAWTAAIRAFVYGAISFATMLVVFVVIGKGLSWTLLLTPFVIVPFFLLMLGMVWFLMALGAFTKDVSHLVVTISPMLMFITPVFFKVEQLPEFLQPYIRLNLVANYIEMLRDMALKQAVPDLLLAVPTILCSYVVFIAGYRFFHRYKSVIVDVI